MFAHRSRRAEEVRNRPTVVVHPRRVAIADRRATEVAAVVAVVAAARIAAVRRMADRLIAVVRAAAHRMEAVADRLIAVVIRAEDRIV